MITIYQERLTSEFYRPVLIFTEGWVPNHYQFRKFVLVRLLSRSPNQNRLDVNEQRGRSEWDLFRFPLVSRNQRVTTEFYLFLEYQKQSLSHVTLCISLSLFFLSGRIHHLLVNGQSRRGSVLKVTDTVRKPVACILFNSK